MGLTPEHSTFAKLEYTEIIKHVLFFFFLFFFSLTGLKHSEMLTIANSFQKVLKWLLSVLSSGSRQTFVEIASSGSSRKLVQ